MDNIFSEIFTVVIILSFPVLVLVLLISPKQRRIKKFKEIAEQDYQNARGLHHLDYLYKAAEKLLKKSKAHKKVVDKNNRQLAKLVKEKNDQLYKTVETRIVEDHFQEVNGIGPQLSKRIIDEVFTGRLNSLKSAIWVNGVGEEKQYLINGWINKYKKKALLIVVSDFQGKQVILDKYDHEIGQADALYSSSKMELEKIQNKLERCLLEINKLKNITIKDFINAQNGDQLKIDEIDYFIKGIFGEWEKIPNWYKKLMEEKHA